MSNTKRTTEKKAFWEGFIFTSVVSIVSLLILIIFNVPREIYSPNETTFNQFTWVVFAMTFLIPLGPLDHYGKNLYTPYISGWFLATIIRLLITIYFLYI